MTAFGNDSPIVYLVLFTLKQLLKPLFPLNKTVLNFQGGTRPSLCQIWLISKPGGSSKTSFLALAKTNFFFSFFSNSFEVDKANEQPSAMWEKRAHPSCKAAVFPSPPANTRSRSGCCCGWASWCWVQHKLPSQQLSSTGTYWVWFFHILEADSIPSSKWGRAQPHVETGCMEESLKTIREHPQEGCRGGEGPGERGVCSWAARQNCSSFLMAEEKQAGKELYWSDLQRKEKRHSLQRGALKTLEETTEF